MAWRRKSNEPVSVNESLSRMTGADLEMLAESSLMAAQESFSRVHMSSGVDKVFYLERAKIYADQSHQALVILWDRLVGS